MTYNRVGLFSEKNIDRHLHTFKISRGNKKDIINLAHYPR